MKKISLICCICIMLSVLIVPQVSAASDTLLPDAWTVSTEKDCCYLSSDVHGGNYALAVGFEDAFNCSVYQDLKELPNGTYTLKGYAKSSGGQKTCWVAVKNHGSGEKRAVIELSDEWKEISTTVEVTSGKALISVYCVTDVKAWALVDNLTFTDSNGKNYLANGDFETVSETAVPIGAEPDKVAPTKVASYDFSKWKLYTNASNEVAYMIEGGRSGKYCGAHYGIVSYTASTFQELSGLPKGTYNVEVYVKSSGGQNSTVLVVNADGKKRSQTIPVTGEWTKVLIKDVTVNKGVLDYSVYSDSPGGCWIKYDDFNVYEQSNPNKNLAMNGGFEVFDVKTEETDDGTGAGDMGAAGDVPSGEITSSEDSGGGMQQNEEEEFDFGDVELNVEEDSNPNVVLIIGICVIALCGLASVATLVILLLQTKKNTKVQKENQNENLPET